MKRKAVTAMQQIDPRSLLIRMSLGALAGLIIISFLVFSVKEPDPAWGKRWMLRPLIVVPLAGAFGSLSFYLRVFIKPENRWLDLALIILSALVFVVSLWLGIILGLDGTLWN